MICSSMEYFISLWSTLTDCTKRNILRVQAKRYEITTAYQFGRVQCVAAATESGLSTSFFNSVCIQVGFLVMLTTGAERSTTGAAETAMEARSYCTAFSLRHYLSRSHPSRIRYSTCASSTSTYRNRLPRFHSDPHSKRNRLPSNLQISHSTSEQALEFCDCAKGLDGSYLKYEKSRMLSSK
ncbi:hypothetical protein Tcan_04652 [Toxocara canis]|uniref:Uncharacterized protein n=1 Tax=Toxocara canis TaxID=6265 RepID=A0A0B2VRA2_TOXCA|nr:hypothetical protein Tcan_04652 [Toxocara canis]